MSRTTLHFRARLALWLAAIALLYAALSPTLNILRIKASGQPQLFAELCTRMGIVKVPIAGEAPAKPQQSHSVECSLCLPGGTWLGWAGGAETLSLPALQACHEAPATDVATGPARAPHTVARSRAPPVFS